jgi:hypothetical protein
MDPTTFYALFSATCFTLVGLWWNVVQSRPGWVAHAPARRAVGGVYLAFLLPGLMGLFAQVGGAEEPAIWRITFVATALVGLFATTRILIQLRGSGARTVKYLVAVLVYALVAVVGAAGGGSVLGLRPIQIEALLLIGLVMIGHGLVWEFFIAFPRRSTGSGGGAKLN